MKIKSKSDLLAKIEDIIQEGYKKAGNGFHFRLLKDITNLPDSINEYDLNFWGKHITVIAKGTGTRVYPVLVYWYDSDTESEIGF